MRKAIVVGAGLGGLASALRLAVNGWQVTILEQRDRVGGRCDAVEGEGFRMDAGPTLLVMRDVLEALFRDAGEELADHLSLRQVSPNYRVRFADGSQLTFHPDVERMAQEIERLVPGAGEGFRRLMREAARTYRSGRAGVLERNFKGLLDYVRSPIPPAEGLRMVTLGALDRYLGRFFEDRRLKDAFGFQTLYLGMSPYDSPALYALLPAIEILEGIWYPEGGMASIPKAIAALAEAKGATLRLNARVAAIESAAGRATHVRLSSGERLEADLIVCNADLPAAYRELLDGKPPARHARMRVGASCFLLYLGIEGKVPGLAHHNLFLPRDTAQSYRQVCDRGELPEDLFLYVVAPSVTQPDLAPAGESLYLLTMAPNLKAPIDWKQAGEALRARMLDRLAREIPDLRGRIHFERRMAPPDFERDLGIGWGAPFGFTHHLDQVAYFRPPNRHATLGNLYFVGANTHPGGGVPMVLLSAKLVTERIAAELGAGGSL
jgi:phytoene desaturase